MSQLLRIVQPKTRGPIFFGPIFGPIFGPTDIPAQTDEIYSRLRLSVSLWHHEAGKRDVFLEDGSGNRKEREADALATNQLMPESRWRRFAAASHFSESDVQRLADSAGIPAGIVVGLIAA